MEANMYERYEDPVCGVEVTPETARGQMAYRGRFYYFCSEEHKEIFEQDPEKYKVREA
jgi:P-type Cu+ transporter